jgi:transcription initiation factor TFIIIB Brf1 subunit/transcription initiation factor TFIIB
MAEKTKAQAVYEAVEAMVASGTAKAEAFKQLAEQYGQPVDSLRGAYYGWKKQLEGGKPVRTRKRETTAADAVEQAIATLRRSLDAIGAEIAAAEERSKEAAAEAKALKESAATRKREIEEKIAALEA